jgi:hypothetical protein
MEGKASFSENSGHSLRNTRTASSNSRTKWQVK